MKVSIIKTKTKYMVVWLKTTILVIDRFGRLNDSTTNSGWPKIGKTLILCSKLLCNCQSVLNVPICEFYDS